MCVQFNSSEIQKILARHGPVPTDETLLNILRKYGPFSGRLHQSPGGESFEAHRGVWTGFLGLRTGYWMLETLRMKPKQFMQLYC